VYRNSHTKRFSCRNSRLKYPFEQIWPTLQLSEDDAAMFRRNSRQFVVDLSQNITLKNKFALNKATKIPHQDARALIYESNLHLDAVGEHPRYLKIRRVTSQYGSKLMNVRKLRLLLGFKRRNFVQKLYEHTLLQQGSNKSWKVLCALEAKMNLAVTRMGVAEDVLEATHDLRQNNVTLNGSPAQMKHARYLEPADVLAVSAVSLIKQRICKGLFEVAPNTL
uniref:uS4m n=1 Tax=Polytomella magna TaxID=353565 RepID=UPI002240E468|nr:Chain Bd, uS4m [Polytomella magna]8APN_Bd Chain Bd, uS4m [Polytomella magna]8APO_Bd Chain Bd, uS4m [Polytomella magna]